MQNLKYLFQCQRRIWLIDHHATAIGLEMRSDLGDWIRRWLKKGIANQGTEAWSIVDVCGIEVPELRNQWSHQCTAQLSIRAPNFGCFSFYSSSFLLFISRCSSSLEKRIGHHSHVTSRLRSLQQRAASCAHLD